VVVGAPTIAAFAAKFERKAVLIWLGVAFTVGTIASALAPTYESVVVLRFVAGLPHGAYFGIAALVAASLLGPAKRGQAVAFVLTGLTIANVVGVPVITWVGQNSGWRIAYLMVAGIFAISTLATALAVPRSVADADATIRRELRAFTRPAVWWALATGALGFAGFFAVYSYVAPLATTISGAEESFVPVVLVVMGLGMTGGNLAGGRLADTGAIRAVFIMFGVFAASLAALIVLSGSVPGLLLGVFLVGNSAGAIAPAIQTRLMDVAGDSQTMAAAVNHSALNLGNSLGAIFGGAAIAAGWGYLSPTWIGLVMCIPGVLFALAGWAVTRDRVPTRHERGDGVLSEAEIAALPAPISGL
jgi:DHA1 family inner membrane transport protein